MNHILSKAIEHWDYIAPIASIPTNDKEFEILASRLDELLDLIGDDENHPLMGLADILSNLISDYEKQHNPMQMPKGIDALKFFMESHHLGQSDLPEIASQGVMSELLSGKRELNLRQIKLLSDYFKVDPSTFIDTTYTLEGD